MNRRQFLRGAVVGVSVMALAARLKFSEPADLGLATVKPEGSQVSYDAGETMADALARSMLHTKEQIAANVLTSSFPKYRVGS